MSRDLSKVIANPDQRINELLKQLTLEEKATLAVGRDFWTTQPIERLGIPSIWLADGPTGVRKAKDPALPGIGSSVPATCFPTESARRHAISVMARACALSPPRLSGAGSIG